MSAPPGGGTRKLARIMKQREAVSQRGVQCPGAARSSSARVGRTPGATAPQGSATDAPQPALVRRPVVTVTTEAARQQRAIAFRIERGPDGLDARQARRRQCGQYEVRG